MTTSRKKSPLFDSEFYRGVSREISEDTGVVLRFIFGEFGHLYGGEILLKEAFWVNQYVDDIAHPHTAIHEIRARRKSDEVVMFALVVLERCPHEHENPWKICMHTDFREDITYRTLRHVYDSAPVRLFNKRDFKPKCSC